MSDLREQRREQRLCYDWPVRFASGFEQRLCQGKMVDICSWGGAFTCRTDLDSPRPGQQVTTLFSVPRFGMGSSYDMANYARTARVCRVDRVDELFRVAVQFTEPLFFKPGEQGITEPEIQQRLQPAAK